MLPFSHCSVLYPLGIHYIVNAYPSDRHLPTCSASLDTGEWILSSALTLPKPSDCPALCQFCFCVVSRHLRRLPPPRHLHIHNGCTRLRERDRRANSERMPGDKPLNPRLMRPLLDDTPCRLLRQALRCDVM